MVNLQLQQQQVQGAGGKAFIGNDCAVVTTEAVATAAAGFLTYTLFSPQITSKSVVSLDVYNGSNTGGQAMLATVTPADNGSAVVIIQNVGATAFNGSLKMNVIVFN